jgi:hypothetical protein
VLYYASMLQCGHLVWILVRTDHPCLGVVCHIFWLVLAGAGKVGKIENWIEKMSKFWYDIC